MFKYFFVQQYDLPPEAVGFKMYGCEHLCALAVIVIAGYFLCRKYRRLDRIAQDRFGRIMCVIMLQEEALRDFILWRLGHFDVEFLPLHLCGLALFVCIFHSVFHYDWLGQTLFCLCMPGAVCALLFPDWTRCPIIQFESLHSFFIHALLSIYPLMQLTSNRIVPKLSHIYKPILFLIASAIPIGFINKRFGTNFMFLSTPSAGSPLVFIEKLVGSENYILGFAALVLVCMTVFYALDFFLRRVLSHKKTQKAIESANT